MVKVYYEHPVKQPDLVIQLGEEVNGLPNKITVLSGQEVNHNKWIYTLDHVEDPTTGY